MTPVFQTINHEPDKGLYGNCMQAVFASIIDLPIHEVPHFMKDNPSSEELWPAVRGWLRSKGFSLFTICFNCRLDDLQYFMKEHNDGIYYILSGKSPRGFDHNVIAMGNSIVHDPSPLGGGIIEPCSDGYYWVEVLVPSFSPLAGSMGWSGRKGPSPGT
jgi:hypothetical protein